MKALSRDAPKQFRHLDIPGPEKPGPGEALVQVKAVGICGSEVEGYLGLNSLRLPPLIMGHEFSGEIVESGSMIGESPIPGIGQRVTVNPLVAAAEPSGR